MRNIYSFNQWVFLRTCIWLLTQKQEYLIIEIYRESWSLFLPARNNKWIFHNKSKCRINPWCLLVNKNNHNVIHVLKIIDYYVWKQPTVLPPDCYTCVEISYDVLLHPFFILRQFGEYVVTCFLFDATIRHDIIYKIRSTQHKVLDVICKVIYAIFQGIIGSDSHSLLFFWKIYTTWGVWGPAEKIRKCTKWKLVMLYVYDYPNITFNIPLIWLYVRSSRYYHFP